VVRARSKEPAGFRDAWRRPVWDLFYVGLTIIVFGVLWLIVSGVERFDG
jgi:hypothetical protein